MIEALAWILLGCAAGTFTGLVPGIHANTISLLAVLFAQGPEFDFVLFIVSMAVVHSFVDFVPSIVLGAPDSDSFLSVLPGHRLLLEGRGFYAVKLTILGGLFGGMLSLALLPLFFLFLSALAAFLKLLIPFVLFIVLIMMLLSEKGREKRKWALIVIVLSSALGLIVLRFCSIRNAFFALAGGFFACPTLIHSIRSRRIIGVQKLGMDSYDSNEVIEGAALSALGGGIVSLFPSIGPSQAAFITERLHGRLSPEKYLLLLGGINTANTIFSFAVLYILGKARTGTASAIKQLFSLGSAHLPFVVAAVMISAGLGAIITGLASAKLLKRIHRISYAKINFCIMLLLLSITLILSGFQGLIVFATAASIGIIPLISATKRSDCMAFLMVPTILFYLGL